ncbi:Xaa-Pro peptidase family protein [Mesorhizobium sp. M0871]|uniref:M24 family metallopeptidase n=1 Tax=Mesorhizobium sp. M0871 TaxID=2957017 RepID=UPI00333710EF
MTTKFLPIPLTGVAFPKAEYEHRHKKVLEAMDRADLDALVVTNHTHLQYLSGYSGLGGYFAPFPLILVPGKQPTYVVREYEVNAVRTDSCIDEIIAYTQQNDFAKVCADVIRKYGVHGKRVGFELCCWNLAPADVIALQAQLPNMKVADASRVVGLVAAVKSDMELEIIRSAMAWTDVAVRTFQKSLRDGVTETEVAADIEKEVKKAGGHVAPGYNLMFGERTRLPHGIPADFPIRNNEPAMIEIGGTEHNYTIAVVRSAVLGRHPETESLHDLSAEALEAAISSIRPGVTAAEVDAATRKVIKKSGRTQVFRHRTGYQTGINWTERGSLSLEPGATDVLQAGMTLHMPIILFSESGYLFGCSEHVLVKESGVEILSQTPHTLYRA